MPAPERPPARAAVLPFPRRAGHRLRFALAAPSARSLLVGLALAVAAGGAYAVARTTPMFAIQRIEVRGAPPAVAAHVQAALAPLRGTSLLGLGRVEVDRRLAVLPDVVRGSYDRDFPHTLRVLVRPERPVAVLRRSDESWLVSARGRVMRPLARPGRSSLPRVWVPRRSSVLVGGTLGVDSGAVAIRALAAVVGARFPSVRFARASERELTLVLRSGLEVRLGDAAQLRLKLAVAQAILPSLAGTPGAGGYLDVSVPERPVSAQNSQVGG